MKKIFFIISLALLSSGVYGQNPTHAKKSFSSKHLKSLRKVTNLTESYSLEVGHEMLVTPLLASVKLVSIDGKEQVTPIVFKKEYPLAVEVVGQKRVVRKNDHLSPILSQLKTEAMFDFCRKYNADLIIMPQSKICYKTEVKNEIDEKGNEVTVDVPVVVDGKYIVEVCIAGHPAIYTNFRDAEQGSTQKETMVIMPNGTTTSSKSSEVEGAEWIKQLYRKGAIDNQEQITKTNRVTRLSRKSRKNK